MNVYKEMMKEIFKKLCIHRKKYKCLRALKIPSKDGFYWKGKTFMIPEFFDGWQECDSCILRNIQWKVSRSMGKINRDLCFAIWHEGIFERVA